jgi:fructuronate reductase
MRLSERTLGQIAPRVHVTNPPRRAVDSLIVHLGCGAFHRAHQAVYTDIANESRSPQWGIVGVSLRGATVAGQLNPQDGLYTVSARDGVNSEVRLVAALRQVLVAPREPGAVIDAIADPRAQLVTLTVTEKGYCRTPDGGLDFALAGKDSLYGFIEAGLSRRRQAGLPGLTLLSCDNLAANGRQLNALLREYLERHSPRLLPWFETQCATPSSMVDRIVPATTEADRQQVCDRLGMRDEAAVMTEPFSQWVIAEGFAGSRPDWESAGATFVPDVTPYEIAKLRLLNGAHSALAYVGLARGHTFVHEAIADAPVRALVLRLMTEEAAGSFAAASGQDLRAYAAALLGRFANSALQHRLVQIAMDGSQKIPQRWLGTLADQARRGHSCPSILKALGAWVVHVRGDGHPVDDPRAADLARLWRHNDAAGVLDALFGDTGIFRDHWVMSPTDRIALRAAVADPGGLDAAVDFLRQV